MSIAILLAQTRRNNWMPSTLKVDCGGKSNDLKVSTAQQRGIKFAVKLRARTRVRVRPAPDPQLTASGGAQRSQSQTRRSPLATASRVASRCDAACRRGHELRTDRIGDGFAQ